MTSRQRISGRECGAGAGVCAAAPYWPVPYRPISAGWQRGTDYPAPAKAIALQQEAAAAPETGGKSKTKTAGNQGFAFVSGGFGGDKRDRTADLLNAIQKGARQRALGTQRILALYWRPIFSPILFVYTPIYPPLSSCFIVR